MIFGEEYTLCSYLHPPVTSSLIGPDFEHFFVPAHPESVFLSLK
jgi:hypothetical protein